jgi:hypothetical protein
MPSISFIGRHFFGSALFLESRIVTVKKVSQSYNSFILFQLNYAIKKKFKGV